MRVWRQRNRQAKGGMVSYGIGDVSPDMSFLEMLDVLNEQLTGARAMQMINQHDEEGFGACTQYGGHHRTQPTPHPHRRRTSNPRNGQTHRGRCPQRVFAPLTADELNELWRILDRCLHPDLSDNGADTLAAAASPATR